MRFTRYIAIGLCVLGLAGCTATKTAIQKHSLHIETRMSETVFLRPVTPSHRVIYLEVRNTSDKPDFNIEPLVKQHLQARGYKITNDPDAAYFWLQANVLNVGKMSQKDSDKAVLAGYGESIAGGVIGGVIGHQIGNQSAGSTIAGALLGAVGTSVANAFVTDDEYTAITDIRLSQRRADTTAAVDEVTKWDRHETRVVSTANQANLDFDEAAKPLAQGLARSVAGMF